MKLGPDHLPQTTPSTCTAPPYKTYGSFQCLTFQARMFTVSDCEPETYTYLYIHYKWKTQFVNFLIKFCQMYKVMSWMGFVQIRFISNLILNFQQKRHKWDRYLLTVPLCELIIIFRVSGSVCMYMYAYMYFTLGSISLVLGYIHLWICTCTTLGYSHLY